MSEYYKYSPRLLILNQGESLRILSILWVSYLALGNGLLPGLEPSGTGDQRPGIKYRVSGHRESDVYRVMYVYVIVLVYVGSVVSPCLN